MLAKVGCDLFRIGMRRWERRFLHVQVVLHRQQQLLLQLHAVPQRRFQLPVLREQQSGGWMCLYGGRGRRRRRRSWRLRGRKPLRDGRVVLRISSLACQLDVPP